MKYIVKWQHEDGTTGHSKPLDLDIATAWVNRMDDEYKNITHWIVPCNTS